MMASCSRRQIIPHTGVPRGFFEWYKYEFWGFVLVQEEVAKLAMTAIEFPPMQKGASFNLEAVKAKIESAIKAQAAK
jgi:hypothetical protein